MFRSVFLCVYSLMVTFPYTLLTPLLAFVVSIYPVSSALCHGICLCFAVQLFYVFPSCSYFTMSAFSLTFHFGLFLVPTWTYKQHLYSNSAISILCHNLCVLCTCFLSSGIEPYYSSCFYIIFLFICVHYFAKLL